MPSVTESILGTLGALGGISARRENDGHVATQAHGQALKNKADQIVLDQHEDQLLAAELDASGAVRENLKTGAFEIVDIDKLVGTPLVARLFGKEADKFFKTKDGVKLAGVRKVPGGLIPNMNPVDETTGSLLAAPQGPTSQIADRYMIDLQKTDGNLAPATMNASSAADDQLITLDKEQLLAAANSRLARMQVGGAFDNSVTMGRLGLAHKESSDAYLQAMLTEDPDELTGGDPVANREFYSILPTLKGKDLDDAIRAKGLDPDQLRAEAAEAWAAKQTKNRTETVKSLGTRDQAAVKGVLERGVTQAEQALADYDAAKAAKMTANAPAAAPAAKQAGRVPQNYKPPVGLGRFAGSARNTAPKADPTRDKLVANLESAKKVLGDLKPPAQPDKFNSGFQPKFEFTEANLRDAAIGKLEMASAEETAKVAQYARDQGVKKAADLAKLSLNDATALATIIAANTQGTSTEKLALWDKLMNFARTGDSDKSPLGAQVAISGAQAQEAQAITAAGNLDQRIVEHGDNVNLKLIELGIRSKELARNLAGDNKDLLADIDKAHGEATKLSSTIRLGVMNADLTIKSPTPEAMDAWHQIQKGVKDLPLGSPKQLALSAEYLDAMFNMAAAQTLVPGTAEWWDFPKHIANMIFREKGQMNMSPMIETAKIEWKNGKPERISFTTHGGSQNEVEMVVGAEEFKRFTGASTFSDFANAVIAQKAATMLEKQGVTPTPELMANAIKAIQAEAGVQ